MTPSELTYAVAELARRINARDAADTHKKHALAVGLHAKAPGCTLVAWNIAGGLIVVDHPVLGVVEVETVERESVA